MSIQNQLFIIIFSLIAGVASIILSNRIMRKYPLPYLSSYFYFLTFFFIFGVYSIVGSQSINYILTQHGAKIEAIQSTEAILIAMGIPFLILAWYMFLRLSREFFKQDIPTFFIILYFLLFAISFILYAIMNLNIGGLEAVNFFMDEKSLIWTFTGAMVIVFGYSIVSIFIKSSSVKDLNQRKIYRWFVFWYLIIISTSMLSMHLSYIHILFGLLSVAILLGFHIIPVLFLNIYLQEFYVAEAVIEKIQDHMQKAIAKYEISKREAEVIELICKGMSNQEISDSLFISLQTVKDHIHRIFLKTGVKNRVQLTMLIGK